MKRFTAITAVGAVVGLVALLFSALAPAAPVAAQNTACYKPVGGASYVCGDGGSFVVEEGGALSIESGGVITGDMNIAGGATVTGNVDVTGNLEVVDHLLTQAEFYMIPPDAVTVTNNGIITPTGAVVELTAAGTVASSMAPASDGQFLIMINTANQTITISETSTARIAGDFAMGQYDTITLIGQGVTWHEVARSNN